MNSRGCIWSKDRLIYIEHYWNWKNPFFSNEIVFLLWFRFVAQVRVCWCLGEKNGITRILRIFFLNVWHMYKFASYLLRSFPLAWYIPTLHMLNEKRNKINYIRDFCRRWQWEDVFYEKNISIGGLFLVDSSSVDLSSVDSSMKTMKFILTRHLRKTGC